MLDNALGYFPEPGVGIVSVSIALVIREGVGQTSRQHIENECENVQTISKYGSSEVVGDFSRKYDLGYDLLHRGV